MSGFRAVQPETRADRAAKQDKTTLEKSRLAQRKEKFIRYVDPGPPTEMQAGAVGFLPDADRFHSDTAGEEKRWRDQTIQRREDIYENKRNQVCFIPSRDLHPLQLASVLKKNVTLILPRRKPFAVLISMYVDGTMLTRPRRTVPRPRGGALVNDGGGALYGAAEA